MDLVISGTESSLLDSLSFDLPPSSQYVQQRRLVSFMPSGASTYSPTGVRVCSFNLTGDGWLDCASLRIQGKVSNKHAATSLQLADGPHSLIQRIRFFCGGTMVEDVDVYNRSHQLFRRILMSRDWVSNDCVESGMQIADPSAVSSPATAQLIGPNKSCSFSLQPLLGILNCGKMLPLRLSGGCRLEITFADAADSVAAGSSTSYECQEMSIRCAVSKLDSALESSYSSMLMNNRALTLRLTSFATQTAILQPGASEMSISLTRAYSRLNALFISFQGSDAANTPPAHKHQTTSFLNPSAYVVGGVVNGQQTRDEALLSLEAQIGSLKFPETAASSMPEMFSLLRQTVGVYDQSIQTLNISPQSYQTLSFVAGIPLQSVPGAAFSGLNTRSGDLLSVRCKHMSADNTVNGAGKCYVTLLNEQILEIREGSVSVLD